MFSKSVVQACFLVVQQVLRQGGDVMIDCIVKTRDDGVGCVYVSRLRLRIFVSVSLAGGSSCSVTRTGDIHSREEPGTLFRI